MLVTFETRPAFVVQRMHSNSLKLLRARKSKLHPTFIVQAVRSKTR
uniref:Uncharacterized protein n=1 Tax=Aegilops tauschii subsp. strangulata TaxID=200361 RepID=A0A453KXH6_AEGTS